MSKLRELQERAETIINDQTALVEKSRTVALTEDESKRFDELEAESKTVAKQIEFEKKAEEVLQRKALLKAKDIQKPNEEEKITEQFSFAKAFRALGGGGKVEGLEREMYQEALKEAKDAGLSVAETDRGFMIPSFLTRAPQTTATAATNGNMVRPDRASGLVPLLDIKLLLAEMGADYMPGLIGNYSEVAEDTKATATWAGEIVAGAETNPATRLISYTPNKLTNWTEFSNQLFIQSDAQIESFLRRRLSTSVSVAVESAAIKGNGAGIVGILGDANINTVLFAGGPTRAKFLELKTKALKENADPSMMSYLINPDIEGIMQDAQIGTSGQYELQNGRLHATNYAYNVSNLVPDNLGAGTDKNAVIFADWSKLKIASWGGVMIMLNPYSLDKEGVVRMSTHSFWDVKLQQPKCFSAAVDVVG